MITPEKIDIVIKNFERVLPYAESPDSLDMGEHRVSLRSHEKTDVPIIHKCGTVHCHAGWYLLAKIWDLKSDFIGSGEKHLYEDGAYLMAKDLGLKKIRKLEGWAAKHPEIWGNDMGDFMFSSEESLGYPDTLADIVDHWRGVRRRLANSLKEEG